MSELVGSWKVPSGMSWPLLHCHLCNSVCDIVNLAVDDREQPLSKVQRTKKNGVRR
jgi:hypothetical protein